MTTRDKNSPIHKVLPILIAALVLTGATAAQAAVIVVTDPNDILGPGDGACTLREAVQNANLPAGGDLTLGDCTPGDPGGDSIRIPPGNYGLSIPGPFEDNAATGDLDILDHLLLEGSGPAATEIDGLGLDRVLDVGPAGVAVQVEIIELSLVGGNLPLGGGGGGIRVAAGSTAQVMQSVLRGNKAERGGGILNDGQLFLQDVNLRGNETIFPDDGGAVHNSGQAEIFGGNISSNVSLRHGAGIYNQGDLLIQGTPLEFNSAAADGGALYNAGFTDMQEGVLTANDAVDGGAVLHINGFMIIQGSAFANNSATGVGGAIASEASYQLFRSEIRGSVATLDGGAAHHGAGLLEIQNVDMWGNQSGGSGGAIYNRADLEAQLLDVFNNQAAGIGSGVYNEGSAILDTSSVNFNFGGDGAGIFNERILTLNESLIAGNQGNDGAGIYAGAVSDTSMLNTTVSDNHAANDGGGIFVLGAMRIEFSTIALNEANGSPSGGLLNAGSVWAKNSLFQRNSDDCLHAGAFISFGYNMDLDGSCGLGAVGDMPGVDAILEPLQNNGGPTETHALDLLSPAIDTADPLCLTQGGVVLGRDQRGVPRPQDGDNSGTQECDRGAFEVVLPSGPIPPVPNGLFGTAMTVKPLDPAATMIELNWDVALCPASGYHLLYGDLHTVDTYTVSGSQCGMNVAGNDVWTGVPAGDWWFVIVPDDAALTEGSWGTDSTGAHRKGSAPSFECLHVARTNVGTCP